MTASKHDLQRNIGDKVEYADEEPKLLKDTEEGRFRFFPGNPEDPGVNGTYAFMKKVRDQQHKYQKDNIDKCTPTQKCRQSLYRVHARLPSAKTNITLVFV